MTTRYNNVISFPGEPVAQVERDAARWLARVTSGTMPLDELAEFEFWRAASDDHDRIYRELEAVWDGLAQSSPSHRVPTTAPIAARSRRWASRLAQMAAAIVALVMISHYISDWRYDYHTAPGEMRQIMLADGSRVFMKGDTALNVYVSRTGARSVELARGEAYFEVRHDSSRPFTVDVGNGEVRDIGTAFSVARSGKSVSVAVAQGVVAVAAAGQSDILFKGQEVAFDLYDMRAKALVDPSTIAAWRRNLYIADGKALGDVLSDLGEYYPSRIILINRQLASRRVNAVVQLGHIDDWLEALNDTKGVSVRRYGPVTVVSAR